MHLKREALRAAPSIQHVCIIRVDFAFSPLNNFFSNLLLASLFKKGGNPFVFYLFPAKRNFFVKKTEKVEMGLPFPPPIPPPLPLRVSFWARLSPEESTRLDIGRSRHERGEKEEFLG